MSDGYRRLYEDLSAANREARARAQSSDLALFAPLGGDEPRPPHNGTETSRAAAALVAPTWGVRKIKVMEALVDCQDGMTRAELVPATGMKENSVNSCVHSLLRYGEIVEAGERDGRHILFHPRFVREEKAA